MVIEHSTVVAALSEAGRPLGVGELLGRLGINPGERTALKRVLRELLREGQVLRDGKRYRVEVPAQTASGPEVLDARDVETAAPVLLGARAGRRGRFLIGTLSRHEHGFGFVRPLTGGRAEDLYLPADEASRALDGDLVRVEVVPGHRGRPAARLVDVVERRRARVIGTYAAQGRRAFVTPLDRAVGEAVEVEPTRKARDGDLVKVQITRAPDRRVGPGGAVLEVVGEHGDPRAEVLEVAYGQGFSDGFPPDVARAAEAVPLKVDPAERARRRDLRALPLVTIDGEDARDFDDSVYVEPMREGYRLVVAIADVAHYVRAGSPLDHEALRRATSVYFPNLVLPMLPERLSNGICSLKPEEDRLCMVADLVFARAGAGVSCVNAEIYEAVMRSAARCTYTEVARVLGGERVAHREFLRGDFERMEQLARLLMATREERGAIDFDLPETRAVLDEKHRPLRVEKRERNIAHHIVEEFMLAANEAVARYFSVRGLPTVYRVHGEPDEEKLELFLALARAHGFALEPGTEISGKALNRLLKHIAGSPQQRALNFLMLRSMMQAVYSAENVGHFGLAAPFYLHFTSPIRRYPDLMVHRLLKQHWARAARALSETEREREEDLLDGVSARSSERERAAMSAEREVASYFAALYLKDKVGQEYDGTVTAVTDFGFFVELDRENVEGLVKAESVGEGGEFDEQRLRMVFPDGRAFGMGQKLRVVVTSVNVARRQIDFELVAGLGAKAAPSGRPKRRQTTASRAPERRPSKRNAKRR